MEGDGSTFKSSLQAGGEPAERAERNRRDGERDEKKSHKLSGVFIFIFLSFKSSSFLFVPTLFGDRVTSHLRGSFLDGFPLIRERGDPPGVVVSQLGSRVVPCSFSVISLHKSWKSVFCSDET